MVEKFKLLLQKIQEEKGTVSLFSIMKMDEFTDKWSIIISAPWANNENRNEVFSYINKSLNNILTSEESKYIARIGIFKEDEYITKLFTKYRAGTEIIEQPINGFMIHEAYILASEPSQINQ